MEQKKPWYKSKIVLFALTSILVFGSNLMTGWLTTQGVTTEQFEVIQQAEGPVQDAVETIQEGGNALSVLGSLFGLFVLVFRVWFTNKILE